MWEISHNVLLVYVMCIVGEQLLECALEYLSLMGYSREPQTCYFFFIIEVRDYGIFIILTSKGNITEYRI